MIHELGEKVYDPTYFRREINELNYLLTFEKDGILVKYEKGVYELPKCRDYQYLCGSDYESIRNNAYYLFEIDSDFYFLADLDDKIKGKINFFKKEEDANELKKSKDPVFFFLRIHSFRELDPVNMVFAGATAYHIRNWKDVSKFCGRCGNQMQESLSERAFVCPNCGHITYPQISPAVIVAVTNGDKILLVKNLNRPKNVRLELVSGFVEVGESFEHAVHREVLEEVGLKVKNIRLYKDQPWGISGAHMIGFVAEVDGDDTVIKQEDEISEAKWFKREDVPEYRNRLSVGSEMILRFREGLL
jgi:NAD+ diphosphatase